MTASELGRGKRRQAGRCAKQCQCGAGIPSLSARRLSFNDFTTVHLFWRCRFADDLRASRPPHQRDVAQKIAGGLGEIVGLRIKELRPEHTIKQIADWAKDPVSVVDLMKVFHAAFDITCDESTTFRRLVEMIAAQEVRGPEPLSRT